MKKRVFAILLIAAGMLFQTQLHAELIQHLDASVKDNMELDGSNVVKWNDLSGKSNDAIKGIGNVTSPNSNWLNFGDDLNTLELFDHAESDSWLDQSSGTNGFCVFVAFKVENLLNNWNDVIGNSSFTSTGFGLRYSKDGKPQCYLGGKTINVNVAINAGDSVVFAFNYNAASGVYEFWESKGNTTNSLIASAADFSTDEPVSLGSLNNQLRFFKGSIGEVRVYDTALSASEFKSEKVSIATKWTSYFEPVSLNWRVIPEDPDYPTDDIIVAALSVDDPGLAKPLPSNPANEDCSETFQEAIDIVAATGGGTVFVPAGEYRIDNILKLSSNVTLRGRWRKMTASQPASGTILSLYYNGTSPVFNLKGHGCGLRDLTFWHPLQNSLTPIEYPFVIAADGRQTTLENLTIVNAYKGIDMTSSSMCCLRGIYGSPLLSGLTADKSYMVSRYDEIYFSPEYWAWSGLEGSPSIDGSHAEFMRNNGTAIEIREMDGFYFKSSSFSGYQTGIVLRNGVTGDDPWGSISYVNATACKNALDIQNSKFIKIIGCTFEGSECGIKGGDDFSINLTINTSEIKGGIYSIALEKGSTKVVNCELTGATNETAASTLMVSTHDDVAPAFNNDYKKVRKPAKAELFNVKDYGAKGDRSTNDTESVLQALAAALANGGGIVFFPDGEYRMTGNLELGGGVELRGTSGGRHLASSRSGEELGSLILIDVGKGEADGTPFISMGDSSGLRGISFHYIDQQITDFIPYPFMVQANGVMNYIIDCSASNPYQAVELNGDDHLVEYSFLGGLKRTYLANNCSGGRIQNVHIKPDFWGDIRLDDAPWKKRQLYDWEATKYFEAITLNGCTDYSISSIYSQYGNVFVTADNTSGQALMVSAERFQKGYILKGGDKDFDFLVSGCTVNSIGDYSGMYGIKTLSDYTGKTRYFAGSLWGFSEETYAADGGHLYLQECSLGGFADRGAVNIVCGSGGEITMHSCTPNLYLGYDVEGTLTMENCYFPLGMLNSIESAYKANNHFDKVYILSDVNQEPARSYGLKLDTRNIQMEDALQTVEAGGEGEVKRYRAARINSGNSFALDVTDPEFSNGKSPEVTIKAYFLIDVDCTVKIYYHSASGKKLGASKSYTDENRVQTISFSVNDAMFAETDDILIEITGSSPLLNYVMVSKDADSYTKPYWITTPFTKANATINVAYADTIGSNDIVNPNEGLLNFIKVSGPEWLGISADGKLSGTPAESDAGPNEFVVSAADDKGSIVSATMKIQVESRVDVNSIDLAETLKLYPNPANNVLYIEGAEFNGTYEIYNTQGIMVQRKKLERAINISTLLPGMYILKVNNKTLWFVKENGM